MKTLFWSKAQLDEIENKISKIESKTSGEIVVAIAKASSDYMEYVFIVSFILSIVASFFIMKFLPLVLPDSVLKQIIKRPFDLVSEAGYILNFGVPYFIGFTIVLFIIFSFILSSFKQYLSFLVSEKFKLENVKQRALNEFYINGINNTADKTGVLIFFSLFEKKVYILADIGIYNKITQERLEQFALKIAKSMKKDKMGILEVLDEIGEILEKHFPVKKDDRNELSNKVLILN